VSKAEKAARMRAWRKANPEKSRALKRRHREKYPRGPVGGFRRAPYEAELRRRVSMPAWAQTATLALIGLRRDKLRAEWESRNEERLRSYGETFRSAHPEASAVYASRWRAKYGAVRSAGDLTPSEWADILESFGYACAYCLRTDRPLTQDHVTAISRSGEHTAENVVPACRPCNSRKWARGVLSMVRYCRSTAA
jgi:5-methylcytosine-specific restriction endonuclease McrA